MASIIYRSPLLYQALMRVLHGRHFQHRYRALAAEIPDGSSVVELCAGDAYLCRRYLRRKNVRYLGLDSSPHFVRAARKHGLDFRLWDACRDPVPPADIVIMQASLHLFHSQENHMLRAMIEAARHKVLVAEPVRNMASSTNPLAAWLGKTLTRTHSTGSDHTFRYDATTFESAMRRFPECERVFPEAGGRELIAVLRGRADPGGLVRP